MANPSTRRRPVGDQFDLGSTVNALGGPRGPQASAPFMIGDYFGAGQTTVTIANLDSRRNTTVLVPTGGAQVVGFAKIAENDSPLPRDRVFVNYSMFDTVPLVPGGANIHRFTPGFEKTFLDRLVSFELRLPMAGTVGPDFTLSSSGALAAPQNFVFGDMALFFKGLLYQSDRFSLAMGTQLTLPTAPAMNLSAPNAPQFVRVQNQSVHVAPYVGALFTPNDRFFAQTFLQFDVDTNGNPVSTNVPQSGGAAQIGRLQDPTFMYVSVGSGYWLYRDRRASGLTGFAPTVELHYNQSLQSNDIVVDRLHGISVGAPNGQVSVLNMTVGCFFQFQQNTTVTAGYVTPVGNGHDQQFNGELRLFVNRLFGPTTRANTVTF